jgi:O-antigen ligase
MCYCLNFKTSWAEKILAYSCVILTIITILGYKTRSGSIAWLVGVTVIMLGSRKYLKLLCLGGLIVLCINVTRNSEYLEGYLSRWQEGNTTTANGRLDFANSMFSVFIQYPVLSQFFGGTEPANVVLTRDQNSTSLEGTHNGFITILLEEGVVGLALFCALLCQITLAAFKRRHGAGLIYLGMGAVFISYNTVKNKASLSTPGLNKIKHSWGV